MTDCGRGAENVRPAAAKRWTEEAHSPASHIFNCGGYRATALREFAAHRSRRGKDQVGMRERVIANFMARARHLKRNFRALPHITANHEKRCANAVARQHFQQAQRPGIVGAVIEGERQLARAWRQAGEGASVSLR